MKARSLKVEAAGPLKGPVSLPGDKSITQRALLFGALAEGTTVIRGASGGADARSTAGALEGLGARIGWQRSLVTVVGTGPHGPAEPDGVLGFGNSGTGLRLTAGAVAAAPIYAVLDGDRSLRARPMGRIVEPLRLMGARIQGRGGDRFAPLAVRGGDLSGIDYRSPVASAQVKSCVLVAALGADGVTRLTEPAPSRDHTERLLPAFGAELSVGGLTVLLRGPQRLQSTEVRVPRDPSAAAFWTVAALIVPGSRLTMTGVGLNPTRTGFLDVLRRMGADVSWEVAGEWSGEPIGSIAATHSRLAGTRIGQAEVPACIDELPVLAVAAAAAEGTTTISGASELRVKESDRLAALAAMLAAFGVPVEERPDGLVIEGGRPLRGAAVDSRGDHRIAMAAAVAGLAADGTTTVADTANIATSDPGFERNLRRLGGG